MTASNPAPQRAGPALDPPTLGGPDEWDRLQVDYLHQVHDLSLDCIKIVSVDGTLLSMNHNGQRAMQVDDFASCQGADWFSFWQGDVRESMLLAFHSARGGQPSHFTGYCPTMKGEPRWWDVTLAPVRGAPDETEPSAVIVISRDVTAEHQVREALAQLNGQLQKQVDRQTEHLLQEQHALKQTNEELENLTYSLSHDLLTPVRHIQSFARLARSSDQDKRERYLDIVERSGEHLSSMIEGVLRFTRAGREPLQRQAVDLAALAGELQVELSAGAHAVTWEIGPLPVVQGDAAQLKQVLRSLCRNAVKFTRDQPQPRIRVSAERLPTEWVISVQDNGAGFESNYGHRLFRLFQRLHHPSDYPGSGAELATVRRIANRHGGRVNAEGATGRGATFSFTLPVDPTD